MIAEENETEINLTKEVNDLYNENLQLSENKENIRKYFKDNIYQRLGIHLKVIPLNVLIGTH